LFADCGQFANFVGATNKKKGRDVRQELLSCNHTSLLVGCRELIENKRNLPNDWAGKKYLPNNTVVLDSGVRAFDKTVPFALQKLRPKYIAVHDDYVFIQMGTIPRNVILGFAPNAKQHGTVQLIDGLWLWTGKDLSATTKQ